MDNVIDDGKNIKNIDIELFKKVYTKFSIFKNNGIVYKNIILIEDPEIVPNTYKGWELFLTAYVLKCKITTDTSRRRSHVSPLAIWYILATSKLITLNVVDRLFAEINDYRFKLFIRIWTDNFTEKFRELLKDVLLLNPYLTDEVRLWVTLQ